MPPQLFCNSNREEVLEKRLVFEGDFIDTGSICAKLKKEEKIFYVYNNHFTGGSYGFEDDELQLKDVRSVVEKEEESAVSFILAGDFNSDADKLDQFPEAKQALELALPPGNGTIQ